MHSQAITATLSFSRLRQLVLIAMGWTILVIGLLLAPLPGPFGLPVVLLGGLILLRNSLPARKTLIRWKRTAPAFLGPVVRRFEGWRERGRVKRRR